MSGKERVLVLCTGNSCRSQMAEGWLRALYPDRVIAVSAGASPAERVNPLAIQVMREVGVDLSQARPKHLVEFVGQAFDKVLTTCDSANETCPVFPGPARRFHRDFYDPAQAEGSDQERLEVFRHVRDEMKEWIVAVMDGGAAKGGWFEGQHTSDPVDQAIRSAMEEGKFAHLDGAGRPFPRDDNPWEEPGTWAANRVLKAAGFAPPWVEERKEIEQQIVSARASLVRSWRSYRDRPPGPISETRWRKALETFRHNGSLINRQIRTYNLKAPRVEMHMAVIDVEREIGLVVMS